MGTESRLFLSLDSSLVLFFVLLLLDDLQERIALGLCLLSQLDLVLQELLLTSLVKLNSLNLSLKNPVLFGLSSLSLALFISTFGSQCIDFALPISCLLLELTKTLYFSLLLVSDSFSFNGSLLFFLDSHLVVLNDFQVLGFLLIDLLLFFYLSDPVSSLNFFLNLLISFLFDLLLFKVLLSSLLNDTDHLSLFLLDGFPLFHSLDLSFLNLVNDNGSSTSLGFDSGLLFHLSSL